MFSLAQSLWFFLRYQTPSITLADQIFQSPEERSRQDVEQLPEVELGLLRSDSSLAPIGHQSSNLHSPDHPTFEDEFGHSLRKVYPGDNLDDLSHGFDSLKNKNDFGLLASYHGYYQNSGEFDLELPEDFTWYRCLKSLTESRRKKFPCGC
ncbi:hypothetical protein IWX49DRAFT_376815 [Phyllosticta citricarpa]|uniref:Uncharacterized protein n=2 Tax=Phyllosticta TaxID=121621 RepID=A0ABR1L7A3_9PEZI